MTPPQPGRAEEGSARNTKRRGDLLLFLGALVGIAAAGIGLVGDRQGAIAPDAIALVDGKPIARDEYARALVAVATDRKVEVEALEAPIRAHVLGRLVDEELLVQRGMELELAERDPTLRTELSRAVLNLISASVDALPEPDDATLAAFLAREPGRFAAPEVLRIEHVRLPSSTGEAAARARAAALRSALVGGRDVAEGAPAGEVREPIELPVSRLASALGDALFRRAAALGAGEVSEPIAQGDGIHLVAVRSRRGGAAPRLEEVRAAVRMAWRQDAGEARLREFLAARRERARVRYAVDAPRPPASAR